MAGSLVPNIIEEFPIDIGAPLDMPPSTDPELDPHQGRRAESEGMGLHPGSAALMRGEHSGSHLSMASLTSSLPDYEAATAAAAGASARGTTWESSSGNILMKTVQFSKY